MTAPQYKKTICPLDCPDSCGLIATVENGKVTALSGDKDHPNTAGAICSKMRRYPERLYSSKRVLYPQLRVGRKGEGRFKRISWEEALDICAGKLLEIRDRFGAESILPYCYAGNMGALSRSAGFPFFNRLGASQLEQTICSAAASAGWKKQCNSIPGCPPENAGDAELIIAWGINIKVSNLHFWRYVQGARKKGAHLIVIDPYRNDTGKSADTFIPVKVGGDGALALGLLKVVMEEGLVDDTFVEEHTEGFVDLKTYLATRSLGEFAAESGVDEATIRALGAEIGTTTKTFMRIGIGLTRNSRGAMNVRCITALAASLGLFAGGAGRGVLLTSGGFKGDTEILNRSTLRTTPSRTVNMIHLGYALTGMKPPVKALVVYNSNPATVAPDSSSVRFGLAREDLFTVVHEQVMTPTAMYADLLLPATTFLENRDVYTAYGHFYMGVTAPVIEPVGEAWSNFEFFQALAKRCGFEDDGFKESFEERLKKYIASIEGIPGDVTEQHVLDGALVCSTKRCRDGNVMEFSTGRFNFSVKDGTIDPLTPSLIRGGEFEDPDLQARFPLRLITPPHHDLLNSTFGEFHDGTEGLVLVHPVDAARFNVKDGGAVILANNRGRTVRKAKITEDTQEGLLVAEGLYWSMNSAITEVQAGGINDLTSQKLTDMGRGATFHESLVTLFTQ